MNHQSYTTTPTQTGKYTASKGSSVCIPCSSPYTTSSTGATTCDVCETGSYLDQAYTCRACPEGVKCDKPGKLETLELEPGYFRGTPESHKVYPCTLGDAACPGSNETGDELCAEGYEGPLCDMLVCGLRASLSAIPNLTNLKLTSPTLPRLNFTHLT